MPPQQCCREGEGSRLTHSFSPKSFRNVRTFSLSSLYPQNAKNPEKIRKEVGGQTNYLLVLKIMNCILRYFYKRLKHPPLKFGWVGWNKADVSSINTVDYFACN